jgi:hypothetical protein
VIKAFIVKVEIGTEIPQTVAVELRDDLESAGHDVTEVTPWAEHNPAITNAPTII